MGTDETLKNLLTNQKRQAAQALFDHVYLVKNHRLPAFWENRLGVALILGEMAVNRLPSEACLRQVHLIAAEVLDAITNAERAAASA